MVTFRPRAVKEPSSAGTMMGAAAVDATNPTRSSWATAGRAGGAWLGAGVVGTHAARARAHADTAARANEHVRGQPDIMLPPSLFLSTRSLDALFAVPARRARVQRDVERRRLLVRAKPGHALDRRL